MVNPIEVLQSLYAASRGDHKVHFRVLRMIHEWNPFRLRNHMNHYAKVIDFMATPMGRDGCQCEFCDSLRKRFITGEANNGKA